MRIVGPCSLGVLNTAPEVRLDATLAGHLPPPGRVALLSQRGGPTAERIEAAGVQLSSFVSVGNKADLSGNDLLEYWEEDPDTDAVLLHLESFGNGRRFARIARRVGRSKPVAAVAAGAPSPAMAGLFEQAGVILVATIAELCDLGALLGGQPVPHFDSPERAARALGQAAGYARWRARPPGTIVEPAGCRPAEAAAIVAAALGAGRGWLDPPLVASLLDCYGLRPRTPRSAGEPGLELRVSVAPDPTFGPVIACGPRDAAAAAIRITPLTDVDAREMVRSLLAGSRAGAIDVLLRLSALVEARAEVVEVDLDVLCAPPGEPVVVEARIRLASPARRAPLAALRA
jgi:acyl-CoA synthetase (NDP forming)